MAELVVRQEAQEVYRVREAVAVFADPESLETAIEELELAGFDRSQISLLARRDRVGGEQPPDRDDVRRWEDDPEAERCIVVDRHELAEGGAALSAGLGLVGGMTAAAVGIAAGAEILVAGLLAAVVGGAGGSIGAVLARRLGRRRSRQIEEQLAAGGLLMWVELRDGEQERTACRILARCQAQDLHVHEITRRWGDENVPLATRQPDPFLFR